MHCKPATVAYFRVMLSRHIVPALGALQVAEVERSHIAALHYPLCDQPTVAKRALEKLVKMFNLVEGYERRPLRRNPCRHVRQGAAALVGLSGRATRERLGGSPPRPADPLRLGMDSGFVCGNGISAFRLVAMSSCRAAHQESVS